MAMMYTIRHGGTPRRLAVSPQVLMLAQAHAERDPDSLPLAPDGDAEYWLPWLTLWWADHKGRGQPFDEWLLDVDMQLVDVDAPTLADAISGASTMLGEFMGETSEPPDPTRPGPSSG